MPREKYISRRPPVGPAHTHLKQKFPKLQLSSGEMRGCLCCIYAVSVQMLEQKHPVSGFHGSPLGPGSQSEKFGSQQGWQWLLCVLLYLKFTTEHGFVYSLHIFTYK